VEILVLGGGAREHALAWRLARDESVRRVRIAPGNGGTPAVAETVPDLNPADPIDVARHASRERYDLVVIGPEAPLAAGVADALQQAAIPVFGPSREASRLEWSKAYAKRQMQRAGVPSAESWIFTDPEAALTQARVLEKADRRLVVKADWLAAGKGVVVPEGLAEADASIRELFGSAPHGSQVLIEERLEGPEVSAFALVSGERVVPLGAACDYKRISDGDIGPNTGGMGAYTPMPWFGNPALEQVTASVFEPIAWLMTRNGHPYRGVLYAGLMLTASGPMVLEFNARFGDPEAQVLLPMLEGELASALLACARGDPTGMESQVGMRQGAAVGVVVASEGYPDAPITGRRLEGAEPSGAADNSDVLCFHAGTRGTAQGYETSGGRVVTFVGRGESFERARNAAYRGVEDCRLDGGQFRTDIARRELATAPAQ
jgi:phosphoribosylamine--glycine ligase